MAASVSSPRSCEIKSPSGPVDTAQMPTRKRRLRASSDSSEGFGWWLASDGKWYPPELHPNATTPPPPPPLAVDRGSLLATDEDRDGATVKVREALVSGQLTFEEHEERMSAALGARSLQELDRATVDLQPPELPRRRRFRIEVLVAAVVLLVGGVFGIALAVSGGGSVRPSTTPTTAGPSLPASETGLRLPPESPSLRGAEFKLATPPGSSYLGNTVVFSAAGTGSQTSPAFKLDGAVMTGSTGQNGHGAFYFLVPTGGTLDPNQPIASQTLPGQESWAPGIFPPAGTYRLEVMAAPTTHWNMTLEQFWVPSPGVTVAASSTVKNLGQAVVVASGDGNWRSAPFNWPADPVGTNSFGGYDMVVATMLGGAAVTSAYLVKGDATFTLPMSGIPRISVPGPGQYRLIVAATGPWAIAFEFGDTLSW